MSNIKINDVFQRIQYAASNGQTQFAIPFPFFQNNYVVVWQDGVQIFPGASPGQYGITGAGSPSGGQITLVTPAALNSIITIEGVMPIDRTSIYSATISNLTGSDLNGDFNREVVMMKQIQTTQALLQLQYAPWTVISQDETVTTDRYIPLLPPGYGWRKNLAGTAIEAIAIPDGGYAPAAAQYLVQTPNAGLPNAFNMGGLSAGMLKQTVSMGVATPVIATLGTDYYGDGMTSYMTYPRGVKDSDGNTIMRWDTMGAASVNFSIIRNGETGRSVHYGADGTDANVQVTLIAKAAGEVVFATTAPTNAFQFYSGTAYQHSMVFTMPNTAATRFVTWQDADGTVAFLADIPAGSPSALTRTNDTNVTVTLGGTPNTALLQAVSLTMGWTGQLSGTRGGTGVNNGASLLGYEGSISFIGAYPLQVTLSGATSINFPTGGTLLNSNLTSAHLLVGNGSNIATDVAVSGDASLANTGALTVSSIGGKAVSLGGSFTTSGAFTSTFTMTANTAVTFPVSGTLATTSQLVTPAALTKTDDTNVTLTLGGSPSTALVNAASLTLGWTGQLSEARGGTGLSALGTGVATALGLAVNGSGALALTTSPTFVTPTLGAASATSIAFSSTSGIIGTGTNNNAAAGSVGEFQSQIVADNAVSLTLNTNADVASLVLQPGDYDVYGMTAFNGAGGTGVIINIGWLSTTSATLPASNLYASQFFSTAGTAFPYSIAPVSFVVPPLRVTVATATTTTVYLSVRSAFITSTSTAGGAIYARRRR